MRLTLYGATIIVVLILMSTTDPAKESLSAEEEFWTGIASWYAEFSPGINARTANMELFDDDRMTCAMWGVPFGTMLRITNMENTKVVYVRVNDRGPAKRLVAQGRIVDLTKGAFEKIADLKKGLIRVKIEIVTKPGMDAACLSEALYNDQSQDRDHYQKNSEDSVS